jgi:multicomponent Na+:H+ antiporter subunit D
MIDSLPPGGIMILGALLIPFLRGRLAAWWTLVLPVLGFFHLRGMPAGSVETLQLFSYDLVPVRIDALSRIFGLIFYLAAFLAALYALHLRERLQQTAATIYAGSAIGAVFAGDLLTLFVYWELTAIASVFLIWARGTERSYRTGMRYLIIQVGSGVLLLSGIVFRLRDTGSLAFEHLGELNNPGTVLIFLAFGIKCAFPLLHNWLQDAYPEGTVTGTVYLSVFTTKLAVYALARGFPGTGILIAIGVTMTLFPIFFAVIENDLRKVLAYSLNNQLGFMVVGVGIGTPLALNGTVAHAFCHILYKSLLFMSMGAVLYRTGTVKASELGGLYKSMPITAVCCIIGAASISAFPLFSGFISKSLTITAVAEQHHFLAWLLLLVASAGVMEHSGIKIPYFSFFAKDQGIRCREAPFHMVLAMIVTAALCILIGCFPGPLYRMLPNVTDAYHPYTASHVLTQFQLLLFAALAFVFLLRTHRYPHEVPSTNLDTDWFYRKPIPLLMRRLGRGVAAAQEAAAGVGNELKERFQQLASVLQGPHGVAGRTLPTSTMVLWAAILLAVYLFLYYF